MNDLSVLEEASLQILESSQSKAKVPLKLMIMSQELKPANEKK